MLTDLARKAGLVTDEKVARVIVAALGPYRALLDADPTAREFRRPSADEAGVALSAVRMLAGELRRKMT